MKQNQIIAVIGIITLVIVGLVLSTGSVRLTLKQSGERSISIDQGQATSVNTFINISTGNLTVTGGTPKLMEGKFTFDDIGSDADAGYSVSDSIGSLNIVQRTQNGSPSSSQGYQYDVHLNEILPLNLQVDNTIGNSDLELDGLRLTQLETNLGSGDDSVRLRGEQPSLNNVTLNSGSGADQLEMDCTCTILSNTVASLGSDDDRFTMAGTYPALTSINVDASGGDDLVAVKGSYAQLSSMTINLGNGNDTLTLGIDSPQMSTLVVNVGTGNDVVNLDADWTHDLTAIIISESNSTTLQLPPDIGVLVQVVGRSVAVEVEGLTKQDKGYVNAAYGKSDVTILISLNTSSNETVKLVAQ